MSDNIKKKNNGKKLKNYEGVAFTGNKPFKNHPVYYRKAPHGKGDEIIFVVATHSPFVNVLDTTTFPLNKNIQADQNDKSYIVPKVYLGNRTQLNKSSKKAKLIKADKALVILGLETFPVEDVRNKDVQNTKRDKNKKKR